MIVNFANNFFPGGHYKTGAAAQEEDIFRRTTISRLLDTDEARSRFYPINEPDRTVRGLYTGDVRILRRGKSDSFSFLDLNEEFHVDVCSIAAFNGSGSRDQLYFADGKTKSGMKALNAAGIDLTKQRIEIMFQMALAKKADVLIVGAFGCGMFRNDPYQMIDLFNQVCYKYRFAKLEVVFAVIGQQNHSIFRLNVAKDLANEPTPVFQPQPKATVTPTSATPQDKDVLAEQPIPDVGETQRPEKPDQDKVEQQVTEQKPQLKGTESPKWDVPWILITVLCFLLVMTLLVIWYIKLKKQ
jgi:uncharacterized protein (TIGR02452 family)